MRSILLALLVCLMLIFSASAATKTAFVDPALDQALKSGGQAKVIITLSSDAKLNSLMPAMRQQRLLAQENKVISKLQNSK
ncbi:MAG: hypothetical protein AABY01_00650, partial [Nanoarchaeota archaeon]